MSILLQEQNEQSELLFSLDLPPAAQCRRIALLHQGKEPQHLELLRRELQRYYPEAVVSVIAIEKKVARTIRSLRLERFDLLILIISYRGYLSKIFNLLSLLWVVLLSGASYKTIYVSTWRGIYSSSEILRTKKQQAIRAVTRMCTRGLRRLWLRVIYVLGESVFPLLNGKRRGLPYSRDRIKRVLLIQFDLIGDLVWATPAFQVIRDYFRGIEINLLVGSWSKELVQELPFVDKVISYDAPWFLREATFVRRRGWLRRLWQNFATRICLVMRRYDMVIDLRGEAENILFAYLTGAPYRVAFALRSVTNLDPRDVSFMLTDQVPYPWEKRHRLHVVEQNLRVIRALDIDGSTPDPVITINPNIRQRAETLLMDHGVDLVNDLIIGIHPGASREQKKWRKEGFASVADECIRRFCAKVLFTGSHSDLSMVRDIATKMQYTPIILAGETTLLEYAALVGQCHLIISNETSTISIASAMKTPIVCLMSGVPAMYGPYNVPNRVLLKEIECRNPIIEHCHCPFTEYKCLQMITPEEVLKAVEALLTETGMLSLPRRRSCG